MFVLRWGFRVVFWPLAAFLLLAWYLTIGFVWDWWLATLFPVAAVWILLAVRGKKAGFKRVIIGGLVALSSLVTIYRGLTWERPAAFPGVDTQTLEYAVDDRITFGQYEMPLGDDSFVVFPPDDIDDTIELEVALDPVQARNGVHAIQTASATVICDDDCERTPLTITVEADADWERTVRGAMSPAALNWVTPIVQIEELVYDQMTTRAWYAVTVNATVAYASETYDEYELVDRERTLRIYTGNAEDKAARQALIQWNVLNEAVTEFPRYSGLATFAVIFAAVAGWGYLATGTFPPPSSHLAVTGITLTPFTPEPTQLTLDPPPSGLRVGRVEKGSNWHDSGILTGDVLVEVGQQPVDDVKTAARLLRASQRQGGVPITVWREGSLMDLWLPLD